MRQDLLFYRRLKPKYCVAIKLSKIAYSSDGNLPQSHNTLRPQHPTSPLMSQVTPRAME